MPEIESVEARTQVLVVDDDPDVTSVVQRFLKKRGYDVLTAASGEEALASLRSHVPALMLLDVGLPGMNGIDVLEALPNALDADTVLTVIMMTGESDAATAAACMQRGAMDYLVKPVTLQDLERAVTRATARRTQAVTLKEGHEWLGEEVRRSSDELQKAYTRLENLSQATLEALVSVLEAKSSHLAGHSARVATFAATVATEFGMSDEDVEQVRRAGRLHDLGMIGIRESTVDTKGKLSAEDFEHIKEHVAIGVRILQPFDHLGPIVDMIRTHHENWDGTGYPQGLKGAAIPLGGRIIRAAEVYDALTTQRQYQEPMPPEEALKRMIAMAGTILDPSVMDALKVAVSRKRVLEFLED